MGYHAGTSQTQKKGKREPLIPSYRSWGVRLEPLGRAQILTQLVRAVSCGLEPPSSGDCGAVQPPLAQSELRLVR
jgi:hypothetical protein